MTNGHIPTYESFFETGVGRGGSNISFVESLQPGVPVVFPYNGAIANARPALWKVAKRLGVPISTRIVGGELWVVRLKPEDVPA